jgi:hypothetical protein
MYFTAPIRCAIVSPFVVVNAVIILSCSVSTYFLKRNRFLPRLSQLLNRFGIVSKILLEAQQEDGAFRSIEMVNL